MMFSRYTGSNKLFLTVFTIATLSSPALAQDHQHQMRQYPLDVEILSSTATPLTTNLRQKETVQHMIVNVGRNGGNLDQQPEMICPTAKSPMIQEWSSSQMSKIVERPLALHQVSTVTKAQTIAHQSPEPIGHGAPVSIASAYPFSTGSHSYVIGGKTRNHRSELR